MYWFKNKNNKHSNVINNARLIKAKFIGKDNLLAIPVNKQMIHISKICAAMAKVLKCPASDHEY